MGASRRYARSLIVGRSDYFQNHTTAARRAGGGLAKRQCAKSLGVSLYPGGKIRENTPDSRRQRQRPPIWRRMIGRIDSLAHCRPSLAVLTKKRGAATGVRVQLVGGQPSRAEPCLYHKSSW
jgi:hypothetical protein